MEIARANTYERVVRLSSSGNVGSGFIIEHGGGCFVVTARHVLPDDPAAQQVEVWHRFHTWRGNASVVAGTHPDADVAVFPVPGEFAHPELPIVLRSDGMMYSQDALFFGYPFGLSLTVNDQPQLPLVKRATISGSRREANGLHVIYLDGINNPGFSGGPVAFWRDGASQILGVVSGYMSVQQPVVFAAEGPRGHVEENTGIILAYDIRHAVEALDSVAPGQGDAPGEARATSSERSAGTSSVSNAS